jgi:hypothetical protein
VLTYHFSTNEVKAALVSKSLGWSEFISGIVRWRAVLFPTFALQ